MIQPEKEEQSVFYSGISDEAGPDIATQIKAHKELRWDHIELRMVDSANIACIPDDEFEAVYRAISEAGMTVSCFASKIGDWSRTARGNFLFDQNDLARAIKRMKRLGTKFIRVMSWPNDEKQPLNEKEWQSRSISRLTRLVILAEKADIILAHENCSGWGGISPENNVALLEAIPSPNLGVLFDTGNPPTYGQDSWEWFKAVRNRIVYVHVKDSKKVEGEDVYTLPNQGAGRVHDIVFNLLFAHYQGGFSIEPHLAAVIHNGQTKDPAELYRSYVGYGREFMSLVEDVKNKLDRPI